MSLYIFHCLESQKFVTYTNVSRQLWSREMTGLSVLRQVSKANLLHVTYFIERIPMGSSYLMDAFQQLCAD